MILLKKNKHIHLPETGSTNDYIKDLPPGTWVTADKQNQGRGRSGKTWESFGEQKLVFSGKFSIPVNTAVTPPLLSLFTALAIAESIHELFPEIAINIKWPNDIYRNGKKVGGILNESVLDNGMLAVITGIGLNLYSEKIPADLENSAGSLLDKRTETDNLAETLMNNLNRLVAALVSGEKTGEAIAKINSLLLYVNQEILFNYNGTPYNGIFRGINASGFMLAEVSGKIMEISDLDNYETIRQ